MVTKMIGQVQRRKINGIKGTEDAWDNWAQDLQHSNLSTLFSLMCHSALVGTGSVVGQAFNLSAWEAESGWSLLFWGQLLPGQSGNLSLSSKQTNYQRDVQSSLDPCRTLLWKRYCVFNAIGFVSLYWNVELRDHFPCEGLKYPSI